MPDKPDPSFLPPETIDESGSEQEDFVFQFNLEPLDPEQAGYTDPLLELIRGQLADLLDAVVLTHHGKRVRIDGFRLLQSPDTQYEIFPSRSATPES